MKRNLLSVLILALLVVNIVLTGIMMFSVVGTSKKTAALVTDIATILQLEVGTADGEGKEDLNVDDIEMYNIIADPPLAIHLRTAEDGRDHYCIVSVALSMNKKHDDYKKYSGKLAAYESLIKGEVDQVIGNYTKEEAEANKEAIADEILTRIQDLYDSTFIVDVVFTGWNLS